MNDFNANTTYTTRFICDADSVLNVEVVKVTAKTVTFIHPQHGDERRAKIMRDDEGVAYFFPLGRYSMSPVMRANRIAA